ncbi:hypothetical conserved protein [Novosphingobium sp. MBES04]|nr:hypothetical conserved protein [Novosphingobium sp. MBES04]
MNQALVALALDEGRWDGDRCVLDRKAIDSKLKELDRERAQLLRARDKGGVVVVHANGCDITTYRCEKKGKHFHA